MPTLAIGCTSVGFLCLFYVLYPFLSISFILVEQDVPSLFCIFYAQIVKPTIFPMEHSFFLLEKLRSGNEIVKHEEKARWDCTKSCPWLSLTVREGYNQIKTNGRIGGCWQYLFYYLGNGSRTAYFIKSYSLFLFYMFSSVCVHQVK